MNFFFKADGKGLNFHLKLKWRSLVAVIGLLGILIAKLETLRVWLLLYK